MDEKILMLARAMVLPEENEELLLEGLCAAASAELARRLRPGLKPFDCADAFSCAAAMTAAACFLPARNEGVEFSAGDVSVKPSSAQAINVLLDQAEMLMAPYTTDSGFVFLGVRG